MANDAPTLNNYTFNHPPKPSNVAWEQQLVQHRLSDGSLRTYNKGYILKGTLQWGDDSWIDQDDMSNVVAMFNEATATAKFYPRPNTYAARVFNVKVTDYRFVPHGGELQIGRQLYEGYLSFESAEGELTATARTVF